MIESIDTHRRGFLSRLSKPVQSLNASAEQSKREAPRPPNAVDEALFLRLCNGCGECQQVCPNSVIEMNDERARLNLDYNQCTFCNECTKVCPTGALHASQPEQINLRPSFSASCNNCLDIDCQLCALACQQSAIEIETGETPEVDNSQCNGCGQCRGHCYLGAITMRFIP